MSPRERALLQYSRIEWLYNLLTHSLSLSHTHTHSLSLFLSYTAIVSNGQMRPGGAYFLITRTLGAELGGAIGLVLLLEHVIASAYLLTTFSEILSLATTPLDVSVGAECCSFALEARIAAASQQLRTSL